MHQIAEISDNKVGLPEVFKALGDPLRFSIVRLMQQDSFGVLELCELFEVRQPAMSHHLKLMVEAGLLCSRREGNSLFYRRILPDQSEISSTLKSLFTLIDAVEIAPNSLAGLEKLRKDRTRQSLAFFKKNSGRFRDQQDLIAGYGEYGKAIEEAVRSLPVESNLWVEVGSGEGELLVALHQDFEQVKALDISADLLAQAKAQVGEAENIDFVMSELTAESYPTQADLVSCNMVLHHVASPADLISAMAITLKPNGFLLLSDLCSHDQEWARESCGDIWLGFDREELFELADNAGVRIHSEQYLALRNGFRVQILIFEKVNGE
tara:strand:+ start:26785 stop:27753 length:969 start_codon:yes stop_codon:yes gene_type:complete